MLFSHVITRCQQRYLLCHNIIGAISCCYVGQPLDTLKVRMQTNPLNYTGLVQAGEKTVYEEGIVALWKGAVPTALGMAAENAMAFGINEALKRSFPDNDNDPENNNFDKNKRPDLLKPFLMGSIT